MLCKSPVNLTEIPYIPLNTSMYLIIPMEPHNKLVQLLAEGLASILKSYQKFLIGQRSKCKKAQIKQFYLMNLSCIIIYCMKVCSLCN